MAATWLDNQLLNSGKNIADVGFGEAVKDAMLNRSDFLAQQGLAMQRGGKYVFTSNLLAKLQARDINRAVPALEEKTGLPYYPAIDGKPVTGVYRQTILLQSGRFAMLQREEGFTLVPWKNAIERRAGQTLTVTVCGRSVTWQMPRIPHIAIG